MISKFLPVKWSISKGQDTYGYNICTLWDGNNAHRCNGGGYDMIGTSLGDWLAHNFQDRLLVLAKSAKIKCYYGLHLSKDGTRVILDGAAGRESMENIAKAIGVDISGSVDRKGNLIGFLVAYENEVNK